MRKISRPSLLRDGFFVLLVLISCVSSSCIRNVDDSSCLSGQDAYPTMIERLKGENVVANTVPVEHEAFEEALLVEVERPGGEAWSQEVSLPLNVAVSKGDTLRLHFWMKGQADQLESGEALAIAYVQKASPDWHKTLYEEVRGIREWTEYSLPFRMDRDYEAGEASLAFGVGLMAQKIWLGGLELENHGPEVDPSDLPRTRPSYEGMEADASWRKEARERIERYRKGELALTVLDASGEALSGAEVEVKMLRHDFDFGCAIELNFWNEDSEDARFFREQFYELFNAASATNNLKWPSWEGDWGEDFDQERTLRNLRTIKDRGVRLRGHVLVWPGWDNLPQYLRDLEHDPEALRVEVSNHIEDILKQTEGLLVDWDVINEPYTNTDLEGILGKEAFVEWFKEAGKHFDGGLFLNDYSILSSGGLHVEHQQYFEDMARYLMEAGAPISGLGMQGHFGSQVTPPARVYELLERYAALGLDLRVTEYDVDNADEQLQADYLRDFLTICFSHPRVKGVQLWGFWAKYHWRPHAGLFDEAGQPRPSYHAFKELVHEAWWTHERLVAGEDGSLALSAFHGDYEVTIRVGGKEYRQTLHHHAGHTAEHRILIEEI